MRQSGSPSKKPEGLPSALESLEGICRRVEGERLALFLDYDGTLTPIVDEPEDARLSGAAREVLSDLAAHFPVALISGRDRTDLRQRVGVDKIVYAGSHGFEIIFPDGRVWEHSLALDYLSVLEQAQNKLGERLKGIEGVRVERKKFSLSVHFRQAPRDRVPDIEKVVHELVDNFPELRQSSGKKIRELQPRIDWNKGKALLLLLEVLGLGQQDVLPLYIGDDETDEDAFRVLKDRGVSILVGEDAWPTAAHYSLKDPGEVQTFLQRILSMGSGGGRR
jgi:trehalose 6-phosphate phosphatase